ncbi:MAG: rhomboid family intramembrane serine protease [Opitutae bacterium]|jgi:GlpG protein|nr:rhomboid family intramembrane serine protease [Opitutae bacterium]
MRSIATFKEEKIALRFWNFLQSEDIESSLEEDESNREWLVWVLDEEKIPQAMVSYKEFKVTPNDSKFNLTKNIEPKLKESNLGNHNKKSRFKNYNLRENWNKKDRSPGMFSLSLIITSVAVFLLSGMGQNAEIVNKFLITEKLNGTLSEVLNGEIWRIITPIFLHFSFFHILFNMFWVHDLGGQIEKRKGSRFFFLFIFVTAIISNLAQFKFGGPAFGGMSGVVYGLFGYVWIKCKFDPGDGLFIHQTTAIIMLAWFFLCFAVKDFGIANWAHAGGLITGTAWGYISAVRWNRK